MYDQLKIDDLLQKVRGENISLPQVQRGFVWKPYQIENFWDSLLRMYPVGSFVATRRVSEDKKLELLDGQQRLTSICIGFHEHTVKEKDPILRTSSELYAVFIDLQKPPSNDNRKYIFRVITKAHPWGYQRRENQKTLKTENIRNAQARYRIEEKNYLDIPISYYWPYDAGHPLPLSIFLNSKTDDDLRNKIKVWEDHVKPQYRVERSYSDCYSIEQIHADVRAMLEAQRIPMILLQDAVLFSESSKPSAEMLKTEDADENGRDEEPSMPNVENRDELDEIENLFVRLNSAGTPLRGEELNYSLLKSRINNELQRSMEEGCQRLLTPPRLLTLLFRLFQHHRKTGDNDADALTMRIKPSQFRRFQDNKDLFHEFTDFLGDFLLKDDWLDTVKKLLTYSPDNQYGLPPFSVTRLAETAPEILFILLYRLKVKGDKIEPGSDLHRKALGIITAFTWLGRGGSRRDHSRLLLNVKKLLTNCDNSEQFWSKTLVYEAARPYKNVPVLCHIPAAYRRKIRPEITVLQDRINSNSFEKFCSKETVGNYYRFFDIMFNNRDIILYAQRCTLDLWFRTADPFFLEDTNRPFDYDHISPMNRIKNKRKNIRAELRSWYNTNGNIRAWPYSWNRSDGDDSILTKMNINKKEFEKRRIQLNIDVEYSKNILYEWACCETETWSNPLLDGKLADDINHNITKALISAIHERGLAICNIWYCDLMLYDLIPTKWPEEEADEEIVPEV